MTLDECINKVREAIYFKLFPPCGKDTGNTKQVFSHWELWKHASAMTGIADLAIADAALAQLLEKHENFNQISDKIFHRARWIELMKAWSAPPVDEILDVLRKQDGCIIMQTDAVCCNRLGLTTQVQARIVYQTDGPSRTETIGPWSIEFQQAPPEILAWANHPGAIVIQAINWLGPSWVKYCKEKAIARLRGSAWRNDTIPEAVKKDLAENMAQVPDWMQPVIREVIK